MGATGIPGNEKKRGEASGNNVRMAASRPQPTVAGPDGRRQSAYFVLGCLRILSMVENMRAQSMFTPARSWEKFMQ